MKSQNLSKEKVLKLERWVYVSQRKPVEDGLLFNFGIKGEKYI